MRTILRRLPVFPREPTELHSAQRAPGPRQAQGVTPEGTGKGAARQSGALAAVTCPQSGARALGCREARRGLQQRGGGCSGKAQVSVCVRGLLWTPCPRSAQQVSSCANRGPGEDTRPGILGSQHRGPPPPPLKPAGDAHVSCERRALSFLTLGASPPLAGRGGNAAAAHSSGGRF